MSESRMVQLVRQYHSLGWALFPVHAVEEESCTCRKNLCPDAGKHPVSRLAPHGVKSATNDLDTLLQWFAQDAPWANIGVACGAVSGVYVLDLDSKHRGPERFNEWWASKGDGLLPKTLKARSGGGGLHYFFEYDSTATLTNRTGVLPGVDFKTNGGYVVLPPSSHASGREYEWLVDLSSGVTAMPAAIADLLQTSNSQGRSAHERLPDARSILHGVPEGERDSTLFRWACKLRRILGDGERELVESLVVMAAANSAPPFPEKDALRKVEQAYKMDHSDGAEDHGPDEIRRSDGGNGVRFARRFGHEVIYVNGLGWMRWDSAVWKPISDVEVEVMAKHVVDDLYAQGQNPNLSGAERGRQMRFAAKADSPSGIRNMLTMARSDAGLLRDPSEMNGDPYMFAVANGVVNLKTGELQPVSRHDLITGRSPYDYDPATPTPRWTAFLEWAMQGDSELIRFLQQLVGYALTAESAGAHVFPVFIGKGRNGKNVFVETMVSILGDLAAFPFPANALTDKSEDHRHTASLYGKRLAVVNELNARVRLNSATVKSYTGDGMLSGRFLYKDLFTFKTTHALWLVSNHRPKIDDQSHGMWSRVKLVPWRAVVQPHQQVKNYHQVMLAEESAGIVAWAVQGAMDYVANGLATPPVVRALTEEYKEREDVLGEFINDQLLVGPEQLVGRAELKMTYNIWAEEIGVPRGDRLGIQDLVEELNGRLDIDTDARVKNRRVLRGVGINVSGG